MITQSQIQSLSERIAARFNPDQIILFGSFASGQATEDSDVDLMIVLQHAENSARKS